MLTRKYKQGIDISKSIKRLKEFCEKTQLLDKEKVVGIYGTGGVTDIFINVLEDVCQNITCKLIFIDSYVETGTVLYRGHKIHNYADIIYEELDSLIISTEFYLDDMLKNVRSKSNSIPIYALESYIDDY